MDDNVKDFMTFKMNATATAASQDENKPDVDAFLAKLGLDRAAARGKPELLLDAAQQKHARIRRELPAVEPNAQFLPCNRWKIERQEGIFAHDGCGAPQSIRESVSQPES